MYFTVYKPMLGTPDIKSRSTWFVQFVFWWLGPKSFLYFSAFVDPHSGQSMTKYHSRWQPTSNRQTTAGWGDVGFEPGTVGKQIGAPPLSYHFSQQ
jgi:hypothetical protein